MSPYHAVCRVYNLFVTSYQRCTETRWERKVEASTSKLALVFGVEADVIRELAKSDPVFEEMCGDFLSLCGLKPENPKTAELVAESRAGLEYEIRGYLAAEK